MQWEAGHDAVLLSHLRPGLASVETNLVVVELVEVRETRSDSSGPAWLLLYRVVLLGPEIRSRQVGSPAPRLRVHFQSMSSTVL